MLSRHVASLPEVVGEAICLKTAPFSMSRSLMSTVFLLFLFHTFFFFCFAFLMRNLGSGAAGSSPERSGARQGRLDAAAPLPYSKHGKAKQGAAAGKVLGACDL